MWSSQRINRPVIVLSMRDESADTRNRMVNVLRELVAESLADLMIRLADEVVGCREPAQVRYSL